MKIADRSCRKSKTFVGNWKLGVVTFFSVDFCFPWFFAAFCFHMLPFVPLFLWFLVPILSLFRVFVFLVYCSPYVPIFFPIVSRVY